MPKEIEKSIDIDKEFEKELKKYEKKSFKNLIDQIDTEYSLGYMFMKPKWDEWGLRLKLYNNQKRDKTAVGDPLLFGIHQTVLASLYDDKLMVEFLPREKGDSLVASNLNDLARYDYDEMDMDILDYEWDWDTTFFGRGLMLMMGFDRSMKIPISRVLDPMVFIRDPRAKSISGDRMGNSGCRFCGWETRMTKNEMRDSGIYFNIDNLGKAENDIQSLVDQNRQYRDDAQGRGDSQKLKSLTGENAEYRILNWITKYRNKLYFVGLANERRQIVRFTEIKNNKMPIIDRVLYPISHDWDGVSVPDIVEDKQRARAIAINLGLKGIKMNLQPRYLYDTNKIKNRADLNNTTNRHIPVDGDPNSSIIAAPANQVKQEATWIIELLDAAAQRATSTPQMSQGVTEEEVKSATEINRVAAGVSKRYSLAAKIFGWSEKRKWGEWYRLYKYYFAEGIDDKILRISGVMGYTWRKLRRENIIAKTDPDMRIVSKVLADYENQKKLQGFINFMSTAMSQPQTNKLSAVRMLGRLSGLSQDEIDYIVPPTVDEMNARMENERIENNGLAKVSVIDDHIAHLEIHNQASDTPAKTAHIIAHKRAMMVQKVRPDLIPYQQRQNQNMNMEDMMEKMSNPAASPSGSVAGSPQI